MKKVIYSAVSVAVILMMFTACDKESVIASDGLPKDAQLFITQHFPDHEIIQVVKERDDLKTAYDVHLSDGFNLDFDKKGNIISVEGTSKIGRASCRERVCQYV